MSKQIYIGNSKANFDTNKVELEYIDFNNEKFFKINNVDKMKAFFMSIVSDSDHWMFISSEGGLTAGRKNANHALFPYYTVDKIMESTEHTGSKTILLVEKDEKQLLWEPFSTNYKGVYNLKRNLYKSIYGNSVLFEEINYDLNLTFRYRWSSSDKFGFVKKSNLVNTGEEFAKISLIDGIQNLIPAGISSDFQNRTSSLIDAYKKNELQPETGLGIFCLSANIVDKPEPSESLKTTTVWSVGLENSNKLLSSTQLENFRKGMPIEQEKDIRAKRGAYLLNTEMLLQSGEEKEWFVVANVNQDHNDIAEITKFLSNSESLKSQIQEDVKNGKLLF